MTPFNTIIQGDALAVANSLPANSLHCIITSPAYYGLRDYDLPPTDWPAIDYSPMPGLSPLAIEPWQGCLGLEPTPEMFVGHIVAVFRELRRALRDDGTAWVNFGDSFAGSWGNYGDAGGGQRTKNTERFDRQAYADKTTWRPPTSNPGGLPAKNLIGIPWRVAFALQADAWYLRSDIIWAKKNPMPESTTDRPTKAHEYLFLLAKSSRYYYDAEAVREAAARPEGSGNVKPYIVDGERPGGNANLGGSLHKIGPRETRNKRTVWAIATESFKDAHFATFPRRLVEPALLAGTSARGCCPVCGAGWVRVVEKTDQPLDSAKGSYFDRGKTGSRDGGDRTQPGDRYVSTTTGWQPGCTCNVNGLDLKPDDLEIIASPLSGQNGDDPTLSTGRAGYNRPRGENEGQRPITRYEQRAYAAQLRASPHREAMQAEAGPAFAHYLRTDRSGARPIPDALLEAWLEKDWLERVEVPEFVPHEPVPCLVYDPFMGSGTVAEVAVKHRRRYLGSELNPEYIELAQKRINHTQIEMFVE